MHYSKTFYAGMGIAISLVAAGCSQSSDSGAKSVTSSAAAPAAAAAPLRSLVPDPTGTTHTSGPDTIAANGIHLYYTVNGVPADVMKTYRAALEAKGWTVTTIVSSNGGPNGGGGATYTGTHGDNYGVFDGGRDSSTYLNVCAWPSKPAEPNCSKSN